LHLADPHFWRAGAISIVAVMSIVLVMLTVDSLAAIKAGGGRNVPGYSVINQEIGYAFDARRGYEVPTIGEQQLIFGREYTEEEAAALLYKGKLVIQSRACMGCHTFFGNGAYYAPDLTKAWLDPAWETWQLITDAPTKEEAIVRFLMDPETYRTWLRTMPDLDLTREEAEAVTAYLKWMASVDTNGFPINFGRIRVE
jgi:nitric oxide reductase subunit C